MGHRWDERLFQLYHMRENREIYEPTVLRSVVPDVEEMEFHKSTYAGHDPAGLWAGSPTVQFLEHLATCRANNDGPNTEQSPTYPEKTHDSQLHLATPSGSPYLFADDLKSIDATLIRPHLGFYVCVGNLLRPGSRTEECHPKQISKNLHPAESSMYHSLSELVASDTDLPCGVQELIRRAAIVSTAYDHTLELTEQ